MSIFSYHLLQTSPFTTLKVFARPPKAGQVAGLRHVEFLAAMTLGSPILSTARMQLHNLAMFAYWEDESALADFFAHSELGHSFSKGWHVRQSCTVIFRLLVLKNKQIKSKLGLLELASYLENVSNACRVMGYSRDTFYRVNRWLLKI